jgi:biopolymer transport protein ExbD
MFTVLVIFLLQNYNTTGEILYIPKEVSLPKANRVLELKPSVVVTVSNKEVLVGKDSVAKFQDVVYSKEWLIPTLRDKTKLMLEKARSEQQEKLQNKLSNVVNKTIGNEEEDPNAWKKITIQADKSIDFLTLKKIMYSVYEAGGGPINFAVAKDVIQNDATDNSQKK